MDAAFGLVPTDEGLAGGVGVPSGGRLAELLLLIPVPLLAALMARGYGAG